jgi:hypothetical protein
MSRSVICVLLAGALIAAAAPATAMPNAASDREFCRDYAQAALRQVRAGLSHLRCSVHLDNPARWSPEYRSHFQWCLHVSKDTATDERAARHRVLRGCVHDAPG